MPNDSRPIGVFDSGIGGLTVLRTIMKHFPEENFIYLGDTARLPYGSKSPTTIRKYAEQNVHFLTEQNVKMIVIACNSASTQMREAHFENRPLYNVIEPGARAAINATESNRIGLIGTRATVSSQAYDREIKKLKPEVEFWSQACPLLVPLAEEGWDQDPITNMIVFRYLQNLLSHQIDTLIMGCTHYPLLAESIQRVTGKSITLVDSGEAISEQMKHDLLQGSWLANNLKTNLHQQHPELKICVTDGSDSFMKLSQRILNRNDIVFEIVNLKSASAE